MARAKKRDSTHAQVRDGWRDIVGKESVRDTASLGGSFGDLVLGVRGVTFILEVKSGPRGALSEGQARAMAGWKGGPWLRVDSFRDSLAQVGAELTRMGKGHWANALRVA